MAVNVFGGTVTTPAQVSFREMTLNQDTTLSWPSSYVDTTNILPYYLLVSQVGGGVMDLTLPPANEVGVGMSCIINNTGLNSFVVRRNNGTLLGLVETGEASYFIITDNSTAGGVWKQITFGAGTSSADAAELCGKGLLVLNNTLNTTMLIDEVDTDVNLAVSDRAKFYVWTGGEGQFTLPPKATIHNGYYFNISNRGTGLITISGDAPVNDESDFTLNLFESATLAWNDTTDSWWVLGYTSIPSLQTNLLVVDLAEGVSPWIISPTDSLNQIIEFISTTGLTQEVNVHFPSAVNEWTIYNNLPNDDYKLYVSISAGGTSYLVPRGSRMQFYSDGTSMRDSQNNIKLDTLGVTAGKPFTMGANSVAAWNGIGVIKTASDIVTTASGALTNTTFVAIPGLSASINTTYAASKVLVFGQVNIKSDQIGFLRLMRGVTPVCVGTTGTPVTTGFEATTGFTSYTIIFVDTPGTAAAHAYTIEAKLDTAGTYYVNTDNTNAEIGASTLNVFELGGF